MSDRELLELAAKAAGIEGEWDDAYGGIVTVRGMDGQAFCVWNPLREDGCTLRLAVKLNMDVRFDTEPDGAVVFAVVAWHSEQCAEAACAQQLLGKDAGAAARRAIVECAAELGRSVGP